jgi:hypothetical protein
MAIHPIEFSDDEEQAWEQYLAHQRATAAQEGLFRRVPEDVTALLVSFLESYRTMIRRWAAEQQAQGSVAEAFGRNLPLEAQQEIAKVLARYQTPRPPAHEGSHA